MRIAPLLGSYRRWPIFRLGKRVQTWRQQGDAGDGVLQRCWISVLVLCGNRWSIWLLSDGCCNLSGRSKISWQMFFIHQVHSPEQLWTSARAPGRLFQTSSCPSPWSSPWSCSWSSSTTRPWRCSPPSSYRLFRGWSTSKKLATYGKSTRWISSFALAHLLVSYLGRWRSDLQLQ